jgi:hypothetical protein
MSDMDAQTGSLCLTFKAEDEDCGRTAYEVQLADDSGAIIMNLRLPAKLVESAVINSLRPAISMAPGGELSVQFEGIEEGPIPIAGLTIDQLIEQSLTPIMLEDEPEIEKMLQTLRGRLLLALDVVDTALTHLP